MRILAIDPGSACGWALRHSRDEWTSGVWCLTPPRGASPGTRYLYLVARLNEILAAYGKPDLVVVEQAHHRGGAATEYAVGCTTHVMSWCAERGIEHAKLHGSKAKTVATGKGNAKKDKMGAAAAVRWPGYVFADDNEVDARWIAEAAAQEFGG